MTDLLDEWATPVTKDADRPCESTEFPGYNEWKKDPDYAAQRQVLLASAETACDPVTLRNPRKTPVRFEIQINFGKHPNPKFKLEHNALSFTLEPESDLVVPRYVLRSTHRVLNGIVMGGVAPFLDVVSAESGKSQRPPLHPAFEEEALNIGPSTPRIQQRAGDR